MATNAQTALLSPDTSPRRYEDLLRATTAIAGYRDIQTFRERFASELQRFISFDYVLVNILDPETHEVRWRMFDAPGRNEEVGLPEFQSHETPTGWVFANQQPVVIDDWAHETRYPRLRDFLLRFDIHSSCVLPLNTASRRVGVFATGVARPNAYSEDEIEFLSLVAEHLALAIDSALNLEASRNAQAELERKNERLELVLDLTNRVVSNLELRDLLREVAGNVRRVMKCDVAGVALPEDEGTHFRFYALDFPDGKGFLTEDTRIPIEGSPLGAAFQSGQVELRGQAQIREDCPEACTNQALREGLKSGCFLPLASRNRKLGVLALSRFAPVAFTPDEIEFLTQIARQVAIAVENALAYREIGELKEKLAQEKLYLEDEIRGEMDFEGIVGQSSGLRHVLQMVETVAGSDSTVLLLGETGTGKELIARAIHERSRRKDRTFVKLNCAAIPTGLLESELFGHEKGAFTGAISQKIGRLELADRGSLFLDEVGDIPPEIQPKLLRALQEREFERLGSTQTKRVDVRLVAATNRDLEQMVEDRQFRNDLYYRLNVFPIRIPPLRDRPEDIPLLVHYFTQKYSRRMEKQIESIPAAALRKLKEWRWPGNIRELENFVERAVILTRGNTLQFPVDELKNGHSHSSQPVRRTSSERDEIVRVLREAKGQVGGPNGAAARLGLKRTTLISRMKKFGINISSRQVS
ncbi:MAG TPA: sigma 54-interacting transcriptional regulator [Candidatus Angelobacter sp.]|nr:sigma 54-interacting transcriptional regulator [Candidatus Angelobacter sp.]